MSTVDLLTSNQAQCKPEMNRSQKGEKDIHPPSEKGMMMQLQKNLKQSKRKIIKDLEKFSRNIEQKFEANEAQSNDEMDPNCKAGSVQIILKEQKNIRDRFMSMENEVENFNLFLIDEWDESEEEQMEQFIQKNNTNKEIYWSKINVVINRGYDIIESSKRHAHETKSNTQIEKRRKK